jgi:hypothetical protein
MTIVYNLNEIQPIATAFPSNPFDGQLITRPDYDYEAFVYNAVRNEWWGNQVEYGWGVNGNVNSGSSFRQYNGMTTSASAGSNITYRIRPVRFSGTWSANETGTLQVRRAGVAQVNIALTNQPAINVSVGDAAFNILTGNGLIEGVATASDRLPLSLYWIGSTGSMTMAQHRLYGRRVLLPGE